MYPTFFDRYAFFFFMIPLSVYFLCLVYQKLTPSRQGRPKQSKFIRNFAVGALGVLLFFGVTFLLREEFTYPQTEAGEQITYEYSSTNQIAKNKFKKPPFSSTSQYQVNSLHAECIAGEHKSCVTLFENAALFKINSDYTDFYQRKACDGGTKEYCLSSN